MAQRWLLTGQDDQAFEQVFHALLGQKAPVFLSEACLAAIEVNIVILDESINAALEDEARERSLRDPRDWPVVGIATAALALIAAIWTNDNDFLGTGVPPGPPTACNVGSNASQKREAALPAEEKAAAW